MAEKPDKYQGVFLALARAMFTNRLHLLRLTEVVRHNIRPNEEGVLLLPEKLDQEMKQQAFEFVMAMMPDEFHAVIIRQRVAWMDVQ